MIKQKWHYSISSRFWNDTYPTNKVRESNFELLRIVSMYFILLYHMLLFFISKIDDVSLFKALWLPLHVAVICFVLISGYFHIKPSLKGVVKLIFPLLVFYLPLTIYELLTGLGGSRNLLFFSQSPYWFIRTYFYLFLIAPVLNSFINNISRLYLLIVLGFISVYMGTAHEPSLHDGKNLILFMFLYVLGDSIRHYNEYLCSIKTIYLVSAYCILNAFICFTYYLFADTIYGKVLWLLSYPYCSPLLILNGMLLFLIFGRINVRSRLINYMAESVFSAYVIHHQHFVLFLIIGPIVFKIYNAFQSPIMMLLVLSVFTFMILIACIGVDKLFSPFWHYLEKESQNENLRINRFFKIVND